MTTKLQLNSEENVNFYRLSIEDNPNSLFQFETREVIQENRYELFIKIKYAGKSFCTEKIKTNYAGKLNILEVIKTIYQIAYEMGTKEVGE